VVNELTIAEFPKHQFGRFFFQEKNLRIFQGKKEKNITGELHPLWWQKERTSKCSKRKKCILRLLGTVCPRSSDPFYVVTYYI